MVLVDASPVGDAAGMMVATELALIGDPHGAAGHSAPEGKNTGGGLCSMGDVLMMPGHEGGAVACAGSTGLLCGELHGRPMSLIVTTEPGS